MRELNIGNHNLGSRGYEGKEPYWAKEDEAYVNAGIENPWLKYKDPLERRFIRSRYHKKKLTGELVTDPKVVTDIIWFTNDKKVLALEKKLEEERQKLSQCDEGSSSQASTGRVAWDKPLIRALNIVNEHSPTRRPHVAGAGTGYKHGHYGLSSADDKNARSERKQREAEEMRESILAEVQAGLVPQLVPQLKATLVPEVKVAASVQADFNALHAWYEGGKQGPKMQVVSFDGNSMAPPSAGNDNVIMETPPAAGNVAGARDSPSMPGSSPSVTCTPAACAGPSTLAELNALTDQHLLGSTASKDKHLAAPQVSVPPRQRRRWSAPTTTASAQEVSAPPQRPAAPVVAHHNAKAEEYEHDDFQWDIPTSSQVVHEDQPASKYGCSKKLFGQRKPERSPPPPSRRC
ncbi:hypothetical protein QYE76_010096 [Lolium multiflorum]|uniref:Uncharacterized protein n=1 Tax=Lolium multiflorum TaxID=4521 RepID=A0AAD8TWK2_LOLMU|nr:hypothetical protein QYE76_010096 [Lolium multiflorum]